MQKLVNISKNQISSKGVQSLADRPNANAQYGVGGLSSTQLKLWFDKLASFLAEKINELQTTLASDTAADYIRIPLDAFGVGSLKDLVDSFSSGDFANKILRLNPSAAISTTQTLQAIINDIAQAIAEHYESIEDIWQTCGATMKVETDTSTHTVTLRLYNEAGTVLSVQSIDLNVNTSRIVDGAVTTPKIHDAAVTTPKLADKNVTTPKLAQEAVTTEKLAPYGVTTPKIASNAVTGEKIAPTAVSTEKIADQNVTTEKLADAAVTGAKLAAGSVSEEKLALAISNRLRALEKDAFTAIDYNVDTGVLTFTSTDGTVKTVDLPLELIVSDKSYFDDTPGAEAAVLVLANGGEIRIPIDSMTSRLVEYMNGIRERMFDLQEAPPISSLADALLLTTPTLAQIAGLS
ncbi:MAG: hypothetical protein IJX38_03800 [Clostridia bacterium]|nr:hypothetical protein [Clostridia bacterium]